MGAIGIGDETAGHKNANKDLGPVWKTVRELFDLSRVALRDMNGPSWR